VRIEKIRFVVVWLRQIDLFQIKGGYPAAGRKSAKAASPLAAGDLAVVSESSEMPAQAAFFWRPYGNADGHYWVEALTL
jgi:hypothetical protein